MEKRLNILFILSDDQGYWAMHCAGNDEIKTPNLDALAASGTRLDDCFCVSPVCSPARASLFTGQIPSHHGIQDWLRGGNLEMANFPELANDPTYAFEKHAIPYLDGIPTFADALADAGYNCSLCGKWHMGDSMNPQHGFKHWFTIARGGCPYYHADLAHDGKIEFSKRYITDVITDDAINTLEQSAASAEPFYISVHYTAPHSPWDAASHPKEFLELYKDCDLHSVPDLPTHPWLSPGAPYKPGAAGRRENITGYYAAITAMDAGIGRIMEKLDELGLRENTLVVFTADNGMNLGHHGVWGKGNGTFPQNMYDTSVKIPFIASLPGRIKQNVVDSHILSHYDLYPTILDFAGIPNKPDAARPGISFAPILEGTGDQPNRPVVIFDEYGPVRMIRTKEWKYVCRIPYGPDELYNMQADPSEEHNLISDEHYSEIKQELRAELMRWFATYTDPMIDGSKEFNTGYGQLCRVGAECDATYDFAEEAAYRASFAQSIDGFTLPTKDQPGT